MTGKNLLEALNCLPEEEIGAILDADAAGAAKENKKPRKGRLFPFAAAALLGVVLFGSGIVGGIALASEYGIMFKGVSPSRGQPSVFNVATERVALEDLGAKVQYAAGDLREEILQTSGDDRRDFYGYMERFDKAADAAKYFGYVPLRGALRRWRDTEAAVILLANAEGELLRAEFEAVYQVDGNRINTSAMVFTEAFEGEILAGVAPSDDSSLYRTREYQTKNGKTAWFMTMEGDNGDICAWFGYLSEAKILYTIFIPSVPNTLPYEFSRAENAQELYQERMWERLYEWADGF